MVLVIVFTGTKVKQSRMACSPAARGGDSGCSLSVEVLQKSEPGRRITVWIFKRSHRSHNEETDLTRIRHLIGRFSLS